MNSYISRQIQSSIWKARSRTIAYHKSSSYSLLKKEISVIAVIKQQILIKNYHYQNQHSKSAQAMDRPEGNDRPNSGGFKRMKNNVPKSTNSKKKQVTLKVPTRINLVVLGTGGPGAPRSLLLTTEYSRYMFNCGEGTQRLAVMSKGLRASAFAKLTGLENIFITSKSWENTGGLLGLAMSLEGQKNPESKNYMKDNHQSAPSSNSTPRINLYGPPGVESVTLMARKFSDQLNLQVVRVEGEYEDSGLTIKPVAMYTNVSDHDREADCEPSPKKQKQGPSPELLNVVYAYICKAKPLTPKINIEKCFEVGITVGPLVGQLQRGYSVTLEDGTVVHPHQVTDQCKYDKRPFLVMECPNESFLTSLESNPEILKHIISDDPDTVFALVVHMTPADIYNSERYQTWIKQLSSSTNHLVMNRESSEVDMIRVREHQARLAMVNSTVFPALPEIRVEDDDGLSDMEKGDNPSSEVTTVMRSGSEQVSEDSCAMETSQVQGRIVKASSGLVYVYRGKCVGFCKNKDEFDLSAIQDSVLEMPDVKEKLDNLHKNLVVPANSADDKEDTVTKYPRVVFLGTGSSEPNRIRSQSCIMVQFSKHTVAILDCGEGSYGQLYRFFGAEKTSRLMMKVKAIFVSHMHADHHLGLFTLLKERKRAFDEKRVPFVPAIVMAPIQMRRWLNFYNEDAEPVAHLFRFLKHQRCLFNKDKLSLQIATEEEVRKELNLTEYEPVEVIHCNNSYGITLTHSNGFKLVYSGDTRPCDRLITAGQNCDLLIHEATHEDSLIKHAQASRHTTFSEAIDVAKRMKAKHVILTHFSQRYAHMVPLQNITVPSNLGIAFDNMEVIPKMLGHLSKMIPAFISIFYDELQKMELKTMKRQKEQIVGD